ncbi:MAG: hypothetical protein HY814_05535 [Candidatus Riflebacteria bacterium]|nr:hypothetical protein [Candidatus Riflebacteria bacterium]
MLRTGSPRRPRSTFTNDSALGMSDRGIEPHGKTASSVTEVPRRNRIVSCALLVSLASFRTLSIGIESLNAAWLPAVGLKPGVDQSGPFSRPTAIQIRRSVIANAARWNDLSKCKFHRQARTFETVVAAARIDADTHSTAGHPPLDARTRKSAAKRAPPAPKVT